MLQIQSKLLNHLNFKMIKQKKVFSWFLTAIVLFSVIYSSTAYANEKSSSSTKQITYIFQKLIGLEPDYDFWTDEYTKKNIDRYGEIGKRDYLIETRYKLVKEFEETVPENETIIIFAKAWMEPISLKDKNDTKRYLNIYFDESPPFFSKRIPGYYVNIVVPKLENNLHLNLSIDEFDQMTQRLYAARMKKRIWCI